MEQVRTEGACVGGPDWLQEEAPIKVREGEQGHDFATVQSVSYLCRVGGGAVE